MPIYEYRCEACGHTLDWLQKVSDAPLELCPSCDERALKRLISAPSFRLKGSGWYETDFKSDKEKRRNLAEAAGGDAGDKAKEGDKAKDSEKAKGSENAKEGEKAKVGDKPKSSDDKSSKRNDDARGAKSGKKTGKGSEAA